MTEKRSVAYLNISNETLGKFKFRQVPTSLPVEGQIALMEAKTEHSVTDEEIQLLKRNLEETYLHFCYSTPADLTEKCLFRSFCNK